MDYGYTYEEDKAWSEISKKALEIQQKKREELAQKISYALITGVKILKAEEKGGRLYVIIEEPKSL